MDVSLMLGRKSVSEFNFNLDGMAELYREVAEAQAEVGGNLCYRAKVPAGGGKSFDIYTGDEESDTSVTSIVGVIVYSHACNAYFDEVNKENVTPLCTSEDGITGVDAESGEFCRCEDCPRNDYGSALNGAGKACKNMRRLYMMTEGSPIPLLISLPPTSLNNYKNYRLSTLAANRLKPHEAVTELTLTPTVSKTNQKYSVVKFKLLGKLSDDAKRIAEEMSVSLKPTAIANAQISGEDYNRGNTEALSDGNSENTGESIGTGE